LPVRARSRLARARLRQRLLRSLADDPARRAPGRGVARGARARTVLEAALRLGRCANTGALPARRDLVARRARGGPAGALRRSGGSGTRDPGAECAHGLPSVLMRRLAVLIALGAGL